jgi:hemolysin activation/secretion protein
VLKTRIKGQLASKALPSSEEFGFGGARLGRGYDSSEIVGDDGIAGSVELRWRDIKKAGPFNLTPFVFYDIGKVWNKDARQVNNVSAASTGIGLDIDTLHSLSSSIVLAQPLTKDIATAPKGNNGSNPKLLFELSIDF